MRLACIGPAKSIHLQRWVDWFRRNGHETVVFSDSDAPGWDHEIVRIPGFSRFLRGRLWKYGAAIEDFRKGRWLKAELIRRGVDILQTHMLNEPGHLGLVSNFRPYCVHFYNGDILWKSDTSLTHKLKTFLALRRSDLVSGFSKAQVDRCLLLGAGPAKTKQVMMGIDLRSFGARLDPGPLRERLSLRTENIVFSPRGITPMYNTRLIVEAASRVIRKVPDAVFLLAYLKDQVDPAYMDSLRRLVREAGIEENIRFLGDIPYSEIPSHYAAARVTVSVSLKDNLPFSMMEAMAAGSACVVGRIDSIAELLEDGRTGLFVDPGDPSALAGAITRLLKDEGLRGRLTAAARETVRERCDHEHWMKAVEGFYLDILRRGGPRG